MMKKTYFIIHVLFILAIAAYLWDVFYMDKPVNDISFSKALGDRDSPNVYELYYQQYQLDTLENRYRLKNELRGCLLDTTIFFQEDGLLTVRFVVNKNGEADRYRPAFVNANYREVTANRNQYAMKKVVDCLKSKKRWQKGTVDGKPRKYYAFINLRIQNGRINDFF